MHSDPGISVSRECDEFIHLLPYFVPCPDPLQCVDNFPRGGIRCSYELKKIPDGSAGHNISYRRSCDTHRQRDDVSPGIGVSKFQNEIIKTLFIAEFSDLLNKPARGRIIRFRCLPGKIFQSLPDEFLPEFMSGGGAQERCGLANGESRGGCNSRIAIGQMFHKQVYNARILDASERPHGPFADNRITIGEEFQEFTVVNAPGILYAEDGFDLVPAVTLAPAAVVLTVRRSDDKGGTTEYE